MTRRTRGFLTFALLLVGALLVAGRVVERERAVDLWERARTLLAGTGAHDASGETFWCPMDPTVVRPRAGSCPICSMELVPFEGGASEPGVLQLTDRQIQQAGVRLGTAEVRDLQRELDTTGVLEVDPSRRRTIVSAYPGQARIARLFAHAAGETFGEGEVLAEVESAAAAELLEQVREAIRVYEEVKRDGPLDYVPSAKSWMDELQAQLSSYGVPPGHVGVLASKPKHLFSEPLFPVLAPVAGTLLLAPLAREGAVVRAGDALFELADLSVLWLYVDLFEHEWPLIAVGQTIEFSTFGAPDQVLRTPVRFIEPFVRPGARTLRARGRVGSMEGRFGPGMSVRATILVDVPDVLSVPEGAVLPSGRRNVVLVSEGEGRFRPRLVALGRRHLERARSDGATGRFGERHERYHEVLSGLAAGERVVTSGNFLLNAEAQFQGVLKKMLESADTAGSVDLPLGLVAGVDALLRDYDALATALVADDLSRVPALGRSLASRARALTAAHGNAVDAGPLLGRLALAADAAATRAEATTPDPDGVRASFGALSREVVAWLRDYQPDRVARGELFVFRCPMAAEFGYDLWVQPGRELQNPYMGQSMAECGTPAELR